MAEKRMFTQKIIDSDAFLDMPLSSQSLYFHLNMRADDEGFINNPKKISRMIGSSEDDMKLLLAKNFIIGFDSGVIVIKHWKMHNAIRADRIKNSQYTEEKALLRENENKSYSVVSQMSGSCQADDRIDKIRLDKYRLDKSSNKDEKTTDKKFKIPTIQEIQEYIMQKNYNVNADTFFNFYKSNGWMVGKNKMKSWKASVAVWNSKETRQQTKSFNSPTMQHLNTDINVWDAIEAQTDIGAFNG